MEVIEDLLRIKRIREESREAEMRRARKQLELAVEELKQARDAQDRRDKERAERERKLYEELFARTVVVRELDDVKFEVQAMRAAAQADAQAVMDAQSQRQKRRETFDEMVKAWQAAAQTKQKFEELAAEGREARARHVEWLGELELEEHPARNVLASAMEDEAEET